MPQDEDDEYSEGEGQQSEEERGEQSEEERSEGEPSEEENDGGEDGEDNDELGDSDEVRAQPVRAPRAARRAGTARASMPAVRRPPVC